jgi:hypothetical protein
VRLKIVNAKVGVSCGKRNDDHYTLCTIRGRTLYPTVILFRAVTLPSRISEDETCSVPQAPDVCESVGFGYIAPSVKSSVPMEVAFYSHRTPNRVDQLLKLEYFRECIVADETLHVYHRHVSNSAQRRKHDRLAATQCTFSMW